MNKLIYTALFTSLIVMAAHADEACRDGETDVIAYDVNTPAPKALKGGTVTITNADGSSRTMSSDQFKVVPRKQQFIAKQIVTVIPVPQAAPTLAPAEISYVKPEKKNRLSLLGGQGPKTGLTDERAPNTAHIESNTGIVFGAMYQRKVSDDVSVGIMGMTNRSIMGSIGLDF